MSATGLIAVIMLVRALRADLPNGSGLGRRRLGQGWADAGDREELELGRAL
jgi:hypothetical protein